MKTKINKVLSFFLALLMMVSIVPFTTIEAEAATSMVFPVCGVRYVSSRYGERWGSFHGGIDIPGNGCSIVAARAGTIVQIANNCPCNNYMVKCAHYNTYGNMVKIKHSDGTVAYYGHIKQNSIKVKVGEYVEAGQEIAMVGNSGYSSGPHLHFEIRNTNGSKINVNTDVINYTYLSKPTIIKKSDPPSTPSISIDQTNIAQGKNVTLTWNAVSNATSYTVGISSNTVNKEVNVGNQTSYSFNLADAQKYNFSVKANGEGGSSSHSSAVSCVAHAPSTVTFVDWDDEVIESVEVKYGENAKSPEIPTREGYTFSSWDSSYYNITSDKTIKATYKINTYTVNFIGADDEILKTEKVQYGESATPPTDTKAPSGYVFQAWENNSFRNVYVENGTTLSVHAVYYWENPDIPIICSNATATRQEDGYYVYFDLKNYNLAVTRGRAVVSLKTADDKLVEMSESAAFSLPKNGTKTDMEVFIPCDKAATSVEIVIVNSYSSGVPISDKVSTTVSNSEMWSDWSDTAPDNTNGTLDVEERTVYRYSEKDTAEGNTKTKEGYIWDGTRTQTVGNWSAWTWDAISTVSNESLLREVQTQQAVKSYNYEHRYVFYHYHKSGYSTVFPNWTGDNNAHRIELTYDLTWRGTSSAKNDNGVYPAFYGYYDGGCSTKQIWYKPYWEATEYDAVVGTNYATQYRYRDTTYKYNFYKWGNFSEWQTTPVTATDDLKVETKTQYRYYSTADAVEDNTGVERTVAGTLDTAFAGKQLTLFVYKVDGASDYTNEYIGQTTIENDGDYSFTFKLREEPTVKTGDFTVAIGIEGTSDLIVIDTIEAPKAEYTVKFFNWEGDVISTQIVEEGNYATLPENPVKEGYVFKGWDTSITNIKQDLEIHPVFEKEVYSIIFVDWTKQSVVIEEYEHGDVITPPENSVIEGHDFSGWDMLNEGNIIATGDMVITAVYDKKVYNVNFYDFEGNVISTQRVAFGESAETPLLSEGDNGELFAGWTNVDDYSEVSHDVAVYPVYYFEETTDVPVANYETGEYPDAIELTLTSDDENAVIYYYINGDEENTKQYTGPVTIDTTCSVSYYAQSLGKNDSETDIRYYCINNAGEFTNWMLYSEIPEDVRNNLADYNLEAEDGYRFKDVTTTTLVADVKNLEKTGWAVTGNKTTKYSVWQDAALTVDSTLIDCVVETQTVADTSVTNYQYSHYKYTDENGTVCYSPTEVSGYTCEYEEITLGSRLSIAGFLDDGTSYYNYNDAQWFTQKKVTGTKTQYRLAYSEVEYYKWTAWGIDAPASSETREYENDTVYRYTNKNYHIVEVVDTEGYSQIYLVQSGKTLDITEISDLTGYGFEGLYLDAEYTESWDYSKAVIESVVVYANYTPKQYTVTFQMQDGTELDVQTVSYMESATAPETDSVHGWVFAGWDKDFSFVTEDMVVTGKYIKESQYARISLNTSKAMMYAGNRITLIPAITPADLSGERIEWSSSDPTIAAVDDNGIVTAVSAGEAVITVTVVSTKETATCHVTVTADSSTTILLNDDAVIGFDTERNLRITPSNAHTVADLKEQFQNEELVFIDNDGNELADDALVGTGTTIKLLYNGEELDTVDVVLTGDFNCDGSINNKDVVMINQYVLEKRTANNDQMIAIDVNGDGSVNNRDCAMLAQYLVEKITLY